MMNCNSNYLQIETQRPGANPGGCIADAEQRGEMDAKLGELEAAL